jgi:hypothetical protein
MRPKIVRAWESPSNEGTEWYLVGHKRPSRDWRVGRIELATIGFLGEYRGGGAFGRFDSQSRVDVYDDDDNLRASLPAAAVAIEYAGKEEPDDS